MQPSTPGNSNTQADAQSSDALATSTTSEQPVAHEAPKITPAGMPQSENRDSKLDDSNQGSSQEISVPNLGTPISTEPSTSPTTSAAGGGFIGDDFTSSFPPETSNPRLSATSPDTPVPVVKVLSVRGVEYAMMTFALWLLAGSLIWVLISMISGLDGFEVIAFPISLMLVCLPIFAVLFLRLRKAELENPELKLEASKRRLSQITQFLAYGTCLFSTVGYIYSILASVSGDSEASLIKGFFNLLVVLVVAGGVLAYYWIDEHRNNERA